MAATAGVSLHSAGNVVFYSTYMSPLSHIEWKLLKSLPSVLEERPEEVASDIGPTLAYLAHS